jgi:hypothetical protein
MDMKKRVTPNWFVELFSTLFNKTPKTFSFWRRWAVLALPGLGVWAWRVPMIPFPGREWVSGSFALLAVTAWYAKALPEPLILGMLSGIGMALTTVALGAWAVGQSSWVAWVVFYAAVIGTSRLKDGRLALALWCCLWAAASMTLPSIWWAAACFALFPPPLREGRTWARWGGALAALGLLVLSIARGQFAFPDILSWMAVYDWLGGRGFLVPILFVWLGVAFVGKKSHLRWWAAQLVGWTLAWGWVGFQGVSWMSQDAMGLWWLSGTGFGLAALRRDLLDRTWHSFILWMVTAIVLWAAF